MSSATPTSAPNTVPTQNGVPIAGYTLNNTTTNLITGAVSNTPPQSYNFVRTGPANYAFNPVTAQTPTTLANNHPTLTLNGYVGGVMVTASGGASPPFMNYTKPYVITNLTNSPGDVGIYLPGSSSEMLAVFNVGSGTVNTPAPAGAMTSSTYVFGSLNGSGLNGARGTYVNPSNFAARAAAVFNNGADTPISSRSDGQSTSIVGYANQLMVTADSVGANTSAFLSKISSVAVNPCACDSTKWGFWSAYNGANNANGQLAFEDQGALLLWVAGVPATANSLPVTGTATYTGHAIANIAKNHGENDLHLRIIEAQLADIYAKAGDAGWAGGMAESFLADILAHNRDAFEPGTIDGLWDEHSAGRRDNSYRLFALASFGAWLEGWREQ